jgi:hypothetical protein
LELVPGVSPCHPTDEDLSVGTPALGYSHRLPLGGARRGYNDGMSDSAEVVARAFVDAINRQDVEGLAGLMVSENIPQGLKPALILKHYRHD